MKEQNEPEAYEKLKELSPGDIIREVWEGEEVRGWGGILSIDLNGVKTDQVPLRRRLWL